ncbi:MAG: hypothetical protein HZB54_05535 [Deltaproteobacteria bacterium]|nr:hypothetical protein [Deltaproteobacteria bacterium]
MKKSYFAMFLLFLCFCFTPAFAASNLEEGVSQLANQISKSMQEKQKQKIAIIDFSDLNGNVTALGQFMAEELTTQLFIIAPGKFEVVERRQIMKLEEELVLGQVGIIEEKGIKKMGQVLGVDAIVTGSMTDLGNTVKINARLIGVESAKVFAVAATDIPKTGMVADLIAKQVEGRQTMAKAPAAPGIPQAQTAKSKQEMPLFQNDYFKITAKSLNKTGKTIKLVLLYENITDKNLSINILRDRYLTDENGEIWNFKEAENISEYYTDFPPKLPKMVKITFSAKDDPNGTIFTAILDHYCGDCAKFQAVIRDINLMK